MREVPYSDYLFDLCVLVRWVEIYELIPNEKVAQDILRLWKTLNCEVTHQMHHSPGHPDLLRLNAQLLRLQYRMTTELFFSL